MKPFPVFQSAGDLPALKELLGLVGEYRDQDIAEFNNLFARVGTVRKVTRIPSSSTDVIAGYKVGDFNWDDTGFYYLDATTSEWRFIASSSF